MATQDGRGQTVLRGKGNNSLGKGSGGGFGNTINTAAGGSGANITSASDSGARGASGAGLSGAGNRTVASGDYSMRLAGIEARLSLMEMGARAGQISFTSLVDGDLRVLDLQGELKMKIGIQSDGKPGISYHAGVAPPKPSPPAVSARQLSFVVGYDGGFDDPNAPRPSDFARVDVHVSTDGEDFEPDGTTAVGSLFAEGVVMLPGDIEDYWVRLVAVSTADVPSSATDAVLVRPLPATAIAAESIAAIHLAAEIILSTTIIAGDPAGAHLELNSTGLRMTRADMTPTVVFSADEGNALITGSIQTALAGSGKARIVFNPFPERDWNEIRFYAPDDLTWSSLFATKDRNGTPGSLGLQGFQNFNTNIVMASVYGEDHILAGVFSLTADSVTGQQPILDGMLISPAQTGLIGGGGPFILHNYKRPAVGANPAAGTRDPFVGFLDTATSAVNGTSVLEFHEQTDLPGGMHLGGIRNLGTDLGFYWGDHGLDNQGVMQWYGRFACKAYDFNSAQQYVPIAIAGTAITSSRELKSDIAPITEHLDPLEVLAAVDPIRFRFTDPISNGDARTLWLPDMVPDDPEQAHLVTEELAAARVQKREDGCIPIELGPANRPPNHYYGLIAEELAEVAPDAIVQGGSGPMIDQSSMNGLLWAMVRALNEKVTALEASGS